ncbi:MAG: riboflavin synthase subunit beta [Flavobacteriaceae bacterium]|nr:MAG: riboflavin synthase subunit beta [Flavobacteriaceae bacterium]
MGVLDKLIRGKNKKFNYSPRYYDDKGEGSPFKMDQSLDKYRTVHARGLKGKINNAVEDMKKTGDRNLKIRMVVIIAILILLSLFILDFDLSIFFKK